MVKFLIEQGFDVRPPQRDAGNVGVDFFVPKLTNTFKEAFNAKNNPLKAYIKTNEDGKSYIVVAPHGDANIPSGIHSLLPENVGLIAVNKSGIASKKKFVVGACLVDPNYEGIIHCHMINTSNHIQTIDLDSKIVQFVPYIFDTDAIEVCDGISKEEFYKDLAFNNRGDGAFGSTGIN